MIDLKFLLEIFGWPESSVRFFQASVKNTYQRRRRVSFLMLLQISRLAGFVIVFQAFEGLDTRMDAHVILQMGLSFEFVLTNITRVWSLSRRSMHVSI